MSPSSSDYMSSRVLKLNVGFLLSSGPASSHDSEIDFPPVRVSDDLSLKYVQGSLRLSRIKEGVLVQAQLKTAIDDECYRCLDPINHEMLLNIEELYAYHSRTDAEFWIDEDGVLDLGPLLRAEVIIEQGYGRPCRPSAEGKCPLCGVDVHDTSDVQDDEMIDPRLAVLKKLLDSK